jgi:hypothetical protein
MVQAHSVLFILIDSDLIFRNIASFNILVFFLFFFEFLFDCDWPRQTQFLKSEIISLLYKTKKKTFGSIYAKIDVNYLWRYGS